MPSSTTRTSPEQLYRLLADNATDVVTLHDVAGRYLYVSPSIRSFGGYVPEDLLGRPCWDLIHPDDIPAVQQAIAAAIVEGGIVALEYRLRDADGAYAWVETTARSVGQEIQCSSRNITERLLLAETPGTALTIELLQALGVRLLLDDFGTGYSSLRYLQRYPLDGLKVDRASVAGLGEAGDGDGAIVEAIVGMARALGMGVIPEGVETVGQLERLAALGCDHAQGFLLSRPLPAEEIEGLL